MAEPLLLLVASEKYRAGAAIIPWVIGGVALQGLFTVASASGVTSPSFAAALPGTASFARALTADTDIILMDEAFSALDPLIRIRLQDTVLALQQRLGKTIVFITHDIDEALKMGSRLAILNAGELVQVGTPQELLDHPANDYVAEFMRTARHPGSAC